MTPRTRFAATCHAIRLALVAAICAGSPLAAQLSVPEMHKPYGDFDARPQAVAPRPDAVRAAEALDGTVRFNGFGTVQTMARPGGFLGSVDTSIEAVEEGARQWVSDHRQLFGLSLASVAELEPRLSTLEDSSVQVVSFTQRIPTATGDYLPVMHEGRIKVGIVDGKVFWVSSSSVGDSPPLPEPVITPQQAWLAAATRLGFTGLGAGNVEVTGEDDTWTTLAVDGIADTQRVRPVALGMPGAGAITAYETIVLRSATGADPLVGYTAFVDALTGEVLVGQDRVWNAGVDTMTAAVSVAADLTSTQTEGQQTHTFEGNYPELQGIICGPCHGPFTADAMDNWVRMVVTVAAANTVNDIFFDIYFDDALHGSATCNATSPVAHGDSGTSPEIAVYEPAAGIPAGDYYVQVCPFNDLQLPPTDYFGNVTFEDTNSPTSSNPRWSFFPSNPPFDYSTTDNRILGCWFDELGDGSPIAECQDLDYGLVDASSHRIPWDYNVAGDTATNTTWGNNARTTNGWNCSLGGGCGPFASPPPDLRTYTYPWTNAWFENACDPTVLADETRNNNDIDAALANLFAWHNRTHDWAYHLGLKEQRGVAQESNFGQTDSTKENDPELGGAQAGAINGGAPAFTGRDNANQLTLNDGIAPQTNMYLWQTIGGAVYPPCVDGDFDASIIAHEYGHLIQNRMVDPDNGLGGDHGRAMGESWSDLTFVAMLNQFGHLPVEGANPFALAGYVLGDPIRGLRNYAMNESPLNFSNFGYDIVCNSSILDLPGTPCSELTQVHADGEIWSAVNFQLRQLLIDKYDPEFPYSDTNLQRRCAAGEVPSDLCPGNRRWSQIMHDAFIPIPGGPSMLDARDAYLAVDLARATDSSIDWPSNQQELWLGFARRGFGRDAATAGNEDYDPTPSFASPVHANSTVSFELVASEEGNAPVVGEVFVGDFEARTMPVADTDPGTALPQSHDFVHGSYPLLVRADGYGHVRTSLEVPVGGDPLTVQVAMPSNYASATQGAVASGDGADLGELIDDTEETNWEFLGADPSIDVVQPQVTVALGSPTAVTVNRVQVSGMLELNLDHAGQNRYSSLHRFEILTCNQEVADCTDDANYASVFTSADGDFPSANLRPLSPMMTVRSFDVTPSDATHVRFHALDNKCTGTAKYQAYLGYPPFNNPPGTEDNDPSVTADCREDQPVSTITQKDVDVRAAELQVFASAPVSCAEFVTVSDKVIDDVDSDLACDTLTLAPNVEVVAPGGDYHMRAGRKIILGDGFRVESGAKALMTIDPSLLVGP